MLDKLLDNLASKVANALVNRWILINGLDGILEKEKTTKVKKPKTTRGKKNVK